MKQLVIFYDGFCPLCVKEMKKLAKVDCQNQLELVDIQLTDFDSKYPNISKQDASSILVGLLPNGDILRGLDTTHKAWSLVGRGYYTAWCRWPVIRWFADRAYLFFARNRYTISRIFTGQARCTKCSITPKTDQKP